LASVRGNDESAVQLVDIAICFESDALDRFVGHHDDVFDISHAARTSSLGAVKQHLTGIGMSLRHRPLNIWHHHREIEHLGLGLLARHLGLVADVSSNNVTARLSQIGLDAESPSFEDAPRGEPFSSGPIRKLGGAFEYDTRISSSRHHESHCRPSDTASDDDQVNRLGLTHH
jgi:hypothetical protein